MIGCVMFVWPSDPLYLKNGLTDLNENWYTEAKCGKKNKYIYNTIKLVCMSAHYIIISEGLTDLYENWYKELVIA